jgi:ATP-binding cassette, subfamily G (WHITE), member 2, SNQ2
MSNIQQQDGGRNPSVDSLPLAPDHLQITDSPAILQRTPPSRARAGSRVTMGYFDREGVDRLRRTLTQLSETPNPESVQIGSSETLTVPATGFDLEKMLRTIMKKFVSKWNFSSNLALVHLTNMPLPSRCRRDRAGLQSRELGVMFKDLHVVGLGAAASYQNTFGSVFSPMVIMEKIRTSRHPPLRDILAGFEGVVRPGEMLRSSIVGLVTIRIHDLKLALQSSWVALARVAAPC